MIYFTVINTTNGFYGHQLKVLIGGYTLGTFLGLKYVHSYYPYLEFFGIGEGEKQITEIDCMMDSMIIGGPFWGGMSFENACKLEERFDEYKSNGRDLLIYFENALRLFPFQTIQWTQTGLINDNLFSQITDSLSTKFEKRNKNQETYFESDFFNIAIQIRQGDANNKEKYPEHFTNPTNTRYQYSIEHYIKIIDQLKNFPTRKDKKFHIYTEGYNNSDIENLDKRDDLVVHMSFTDNKYDNNSAYIDFLHLVNSDLLVSTTSSFSAMALQFRSEKLTFYHPHDHLNNLPNDIYIPVDVNGDFEVSDDIKANFYE